MSWRWCRAGGIQAAMPRSHATFHGVPLMPPSTPTRRGACSPLHVDLLLLRRRTPVKGLDLVPKPTRARIFGGIAGRSYPYRPCLPRYRSCRPAQRHVARPDVRALAPRHHAIVPCAWIAGAVGRPWPLPPCGHGAGTVCAGLALCLPPGALVRPPVVQRRMLYRIDMFIGKV